MVQTPVYGAFGDHVTGGEPDSPLGFHGQEWRSESGLYQMRHRWHDPGTRRFLSRDPVLQGSVSNYEFVGGNPVMNWDSMGLTVTALAAEPGSGKSAFGHLGLVVEDAAGRVAVVNHGGGAPAGDRGRARRIDKHNRRTGDEEIDAFVSHYADKGQAVNAWEVQMSPQQEAAMVDYIWSEDSLYEDWTLAGNHCGSALDRALYGFPGAPARPTRPLQLSVAGGMAPAVGTTIGRQAPSQSPSAWTNRLNSDAAGGLCVVGCYTYEPP